MKILRTGDTLRLTLEMALVFSWKCIFSMLMSKVIHRGQYSDVVIRRQIEIEVKDLKLDQYGYTAVVDEHIGDTYVNTPIPVIKEVRTIH